VTLAHHRTGSGEPLVLIHGIGSRWQIWEPVIEQLARHHEVIAVDLPGFGASPPDETAPTVKALAARVQRFFDESRIERPHVAGNSSITDSSFQVPRSRHADAQSVADPRWKVLMTLTICRHTRRDAEGSLES
jgi:hypothetical protein